MTTPVNEAVRRYKIVVAYDGTAYAGWQVQPNGVTIQEKLEAVLHQLTGETRKIHGSGRTDHAPAVKWRSVLALMDQASSPLATAAI